MRRLLEINSYYSKCLVDDSLTKQYSAIERATGLVIAGNKRFEGFFFLKIGVVV